MRILYTRVSTLEQKTDRQKVNQNNYDVVVEDKVSGAIPFSERNGGKQVFGYAENGILKELHVWEIDRLGRNLRDVLNTIHFFTQKGIRIHFINQGLSTLDQAGKENPIAKMMISVLGIVGEMERNQIRERQLAGIHLAKIKGAYKGRKSGTKEDVLTFLQKTKNKKALELLRKGYKASEAAAIVGIHPNTVTKIKKLGLQSDANQ